MKKFSKLKLVGLLAILAVALVFLGINSLQAKKPNNPGKGKPKWEWKVGIPNLAMANDDGCNLYANPHGNPMDQPISTEYIVYDSNDFVDVDFWTSEDKDTGQIDSVFSLKIANTEKGISNDPGDYSIGFRDVRFRGCKSYCFLGGTGPCRCWVFPNSLYPDGVGCSDEDDCASINCSGPTYLYGSDGFQVMKEFMETSAHPRNGYDHFSLRFIVYHDIEVMEVGGDPVTVDGYMWRLNVWNTGDTLLLGDEKYHNIICQYSIPLEGVLVEMLGENEWKITVDQCGQNDTDNCKSYLTNNSGRYIAFWEFYNQGIEKQKGKSGKSYIESERRWALGAATPFKFITKWTRGKQ